MTLFGMGPFIGLVCILVANSSQARFLASEDFAYPYKNPYYSTLTSQLVVPENPIIKYKTIHLSLYPDRKKVPYFPDHNRVQVGYIPQKDKRAPLSFIIAGTGANFHSISNQYLAKYFHSKGHQILMLPSPFYLKYIFAVSDYGVPGLTQLDAKKLHSLMGLALTKIQLRYQAFPKQYNISGYSLGALEAAFIAKLDSEKDQRRFNFEKVLLVNPPYRLDISAQKLDKLYSIAMSLGPKKQEKLKTKFWYTNFSLARNHISLNDWTNGTAKLPYRFYYKEFQAMIGFSFRDTLSHAILAKEHIDPIGLIAPDEVHTYSSTPGIKSALRLSFMDYFHQVAAPHWENHFGTEEGFDSIIAQNSLYGITDFLKSSDNIFLVHNKDDIILGPGEIEEIERVFEDRSIIFPRGGHVGNLWYQDVYRHYDELLSW